MKTSPVIRRSSLFSLTFPNFNQALIQAKQMYMPVFVVSVYFPGVLNVFDSCTYLSHTRSTIILNYDGLKKSFSTGDTGNRLKKMTD
jgi:hypothetical protein